MKLFWCILIIIIQIVISNHVGKNTDWKKTAKVRMCYTSKGKRGVCLPPQMCGKQESHGRSNDIFRHHCNRDIGNSMVCCSVKKSWPHYKSQHLANSDFSLFAISSSSPIQRFSSELLSTASPQSELKPSARVELHSSVLPSTCTDRSVSISPAAVRDPSSFRFERSPQSITVIPDIESGASSSPSPQRPLLSALSMLNILRLSLNLTAPSSATSAPSPLSPQSVTTIPNAVSIASSSPNSQRRLSSAQSVTAIPDAESGASSSPSPQRPLLSALSMLNILRLSLNWTAPSSATSAPSLLSPQSVTTIPYAVSIASSSPNSQRRLSSAQSVTDIPDAESGASSSSSPQRPLLSALSMLNILGLSLNLTAPNSATSAPSPLGPQSVTTIPNGSDVSNTSSSRPPLLSIQTMLRIPSLMSVVSAASRRARSLSSVTRAPVSDTDSPNLEQLISNIFPSTVNPGELLLSISPISNSNSSNDILSSNATSESSTQVPTTSGVSTSSSPNLMESDFATAFPEPPVCGVSQGSFSRVVGGNNASIGDFPWVGVIAYRVEGGFLLKCGASLITSQHALTAAHCIVGNGNIYFVRFGELDYTDHNKTRPVDALVKRTIAHEEYSTNNLTNDIGILIFYRKLIFTDFIRPICLPLSAELRSESFVDYSPFVAGWGRTAYQGPLSTRLQMLQMPVVSQQRCKKAYAPITFVVIDERVLCVGDIAGKDACHGDSGGPLMQPIWNSTNHTSYFYQTGVISLGVKCGMLGFPGVYTRITKFIPWIQQHVLGSTPT